MNHLNISPSQRKCVAKCLEKSNKENTPCMSIELNNGKIYIIINPSFNPIFNELDEDVRIIFNENGYLNEGVVVRGVQASPISLTIGLKEN